MCPIIRNPFADILIMSSLFANRIDSRIDCLKKRREKKTHLKKKTKLFSL